MPTSLSDSLIAEIDARVAARMENGHWPGLALGIEYQGQTTVRAYGLADLEHRVPVQAETIFPIGSIAKQFTAGLILKLQEMGMLWVEDKVVQHLPDFPSHGHAITIHHLLTYTSGVARYSQPDYGRRSREDLSQTEVLALFQDLPLRFEPGTQHENSKSGYYLLGLIAERVTGRPYVDAVDEYVFQPLGLNHTTFMSTSRITPNRARGYVWDEGGHRNAPYISVWVPGDGGWGLGSTVADLLKWQRSLTDGELLSADSRAAMRRPTALSTGEQVRCGCNIWIGEFEGEPKFTNRSAVNGFSGVLSSYPAHDLAIAVSTNIDGLSNAPYAVLDGETARLVLDLPPLKHGPDCAAENLDASVPQPDLTPATRFCGTCVRESALPGTAFFRSRETA